MKRLLLVLLIPLFLLLGCDSFLDIVPEEDMTTLNSVFETRDDALLWLQSCYTFLQKPTPCRSGNEDFVGADEVVTGDKMHWIRMVIFGQKVTVLMVKEIIMRE